MLVFVLDKPIVADPLIQSCLFDLIVLLLRQSEGGQMDEKLISIANNLFRMLELDLIWGQMAGQVSRIKSGDPEGTHLVLQAVSFAIMHLSVCDEASPMIHLHLVINIILEQLFSQYLSFSPLIVSEMFELCLLLLAKLPINLNSLTKNSILLVDSSVSELGRTLIDGNGLPKDLDTTTVVQSMALNAQLLLSNSSQLLIFIEGQIEIATRIEILSKASSILSVLLHRLKPDSASLLSLKYSLWIEALSAGVKVTDDAAVIEAILKQIADHSTYWTTHTIPTVKAALIDCLLPKLWMLINHEGRGLSAIAPLIARVAHVFPKEADVSFATIISDALRHHQCDALENFSLLWDYCMNANLLLSVPLRLSLTVLTEALCGQESVFKSRKCTFTWTFVLCKHLSVLLDPILAELADVIECGFSSAVSLNLHQRTGQSPANAFPKAFKKSFDADEVVYYLDLLHSLLEVKFDGVMNFLQGHEVSPALLNQWMAFEDSLRSVLQIELKGVDRRSYYNLVLVLMVPLLLLDDGYSEQQVKASALQLMSQLGRSANRDSVIILNVLIALSIDNLSTAVARDVEKQIILIGFFLDLFRGSEFIAGLFDREDIVALSELARKALWGVSDIEVVQAWTDFILAIAFLPRSDVELIPTVLMDSIYLRLTNGANLEGINEALLTSLLASIAKLTVFYFASKALPATSASSLQRSVSGLLADTIQDIIAAGPFDPRSSTAAINFGALESVLFAFLEVQQWLQVSHLSGIVDGSSWSQCLIMLSDTCRQFYLMSPACFIPLLINLFMKQQSSDKVNTSTLTCL